MGMGRRGEGGRVHGYDAAMVTGRELLALSVVVVVIVVLYLVVLTGPIGNRMVL